MTTVPTLVPEPRECIDLGGTLQLSDVVAVAGPAGITATIADLLGEGIGAILLPRSVAASPEHEPVVLTVDQGDHPPGGYGLSVDDSGITIEYADHEGLVNAVQTLRQLAGPAAFSRGHVPGSRPSLPHVRITDAPALAWRGVHLDVARHFMPLVNLYDFVDNLALHKINVLHLHLTEDQGWRFEVKKYPRLTEVGSWRTGTRFPDWDEDDQVPHGGHYTQDQLRALVGHAHSRGITIVPEIDLPGHVSALLAAHPEYGEPGNLPDGVATGWGIFTEVLHLDDAAMDLVTDILAELLEVFDSPWIHVGGDECPRDQWRNSERARTLAAERGLASVDELQPWFTQQLRSWLADRGRTLVGWDEIIDDDAQVPGAVVMSWRGTEPGLRALAAGHQVVMAPGSTLYLDKYASDDPTEPRAIGGHIPWEKVASMDPYEGVEDDQRDGLLGIQAQLWSEYLVTPQRVEYAAYPRVSVMAEVAWRGGPVDPDQFRPRLAAHLERLAVRGVNYRPLDGPLPWQTGGGRYRRIAK